MGVEVLETISKDREEFSRYFHYMKSEIDKESQLIYAHDKGKAEGLAEGITEGFEQGKTEVAINIVKNLSMTVSKAMEITKLPEEKKESLIRELENKQIPYVL